MNPKLLSLLHSTPEWLVTFGLVTALLLTPPSSLSSSLGSSHRFTNMPATQGSVVAAAVTRVGSDFQISWATIGDVEKVRIEEGISPEQINNLIAEVSGVTVKTVTGLDPTQRHYFRIKAGSGDGIIAAERGVPQIGVLNFRDIGGYSTCSMIMNPAWASG